MSRKYELTDADYDNYHGGDNQCGCDIDLAWKEAQKKLLEYLMETCPHSRGDFRDSDESVTQCFRHACGLCMQSLLKDFGIRG